MKDTPPATEAQRPDPELRGGCPGPAPRLTHLPQGGQQGKVDGLPVPQDAQDAVQVHLVFAETPWRDRNSAYSPRFGRITKQLDTNPSPLL